MNKPFTVEEYTKDPSKLRHKNESAPPLTSWLDSNGRDVITVWKTATGSINTVVYDPFVHYLLRLETKYEVRRARPWRWKDRDHTGGIISSDFYDTMSTDSEFCGPEFEYKVEV